MVSATDMEPGISGSGVVLIYGVFFRRLGQVAEWQTRTVQVRVSVRTWGFNSPLAHTVKAWISGPSVISGRGTMVSTYLDSFDRVWSEASPLD
jgi:hypothetical protein